MEKCCSEQNRFRFIKAQYQKKKKKVEENVSVTVHTSVGKKLNILIFNQTEST